MIYKKRKRGPLSPKLHLQNLKEDLRLTVNHMPTSRAYLHGQGDTFYDRPGLHGGWGSSLADEWKGGYLCHKYWGCGTDMADGCGRTGKEKQKSSA